MPKLDSDLIPFVIFIGCVMAATGALQGWVFFSLLQN